MSEQGRAEAAATGGLFLVFVAIIAAALCLASWGAADIPLTVAAAVVTLVSFVGGIACFSSQADEPAPDELGVA